MLPPGHHTKFKPTLYAKKATWRSIFLEGLPAFLKSIDPKQFLAGRVAIYLLPMFTNGNKSYPWMILDVEDALQHKTSIAANIESGRQFLRLLCEHKLEVGLIIFLTGNGLRFCWPYLVRKELQSAFNSWLRDKKNFPWIDPTPFRSQSPLRIAGNRNHSSQGEVLKRHIHRLESIHDLWFLSEGEYLEAVSGTIDIGTSSGWIAEVLPTGFTPERWINFLQQYQAIEVLSQSIFRPIIPEKKYRKPISAIASQAGLEYREHLFEHGEVLKLDVCPVCARKDGNPYVTQSGRLKCYHRNTCEAGAVDEHGNIIGMALGVWLPGIEDDDTGEQFSEEEHIDRITVEAARGALRKALRGDSDACVRLSPGAGKSHTTVQALTTELQGCGKVAIATPEHKLSGEHYELARSIGRDPESIHWLKGRSSENCSRITKVQQVADAGFSPGSVVCPSCNQRQNKTCQYLEQFKKLEEEKYKLCLMTHAMSVEVPFSKYGFNLLVVDESPIKTFFQKTVSNIGAMQMIGSKLPPRGRAAMAKLLELVPKKLEGMQAAGANKYDLSRIYASDAPAQSHWSEFPDLWTVAGLANDDMECLMSDLAMFQRWEDRGDGNPETMGQWHKRLYYEERVDLTALNWLWSALAKTPGTYIRFKPDPKNPAQFISFTKSLPQYKDRIICLDATGSLAEVENLFERKFLNITGKIEMPGLRTAWVKQAGGKIKMRRMADRQIVAMLKNAADFLKPSDTEVLITTHKAVEETAKRLAEELLPGRNIHICHYWGGSRGVNEFQDCTAVIALGTPFPNIDGYFDHAMALIPDPEARLKWISKVGTNELIQALHRIRPIKGNRIVIVCGRDFPVEEFGKPMFKLNRQRGYKPSGTAVTEIVERLSPFVERWRFMTKEIAWTYKIYHNADKAKAIQVYEFIINFIVDVENHAHNPLNLLDETLRDEKGNVFTRGYLLRRLLLSIRDSKAYLFQPYVTHTHHETWDTALKILAEKFNLPQLTVSGRLYNFQKTTGIGYLRDVRSFYEHIGQKFEPKSWSGIESEGDFK